MPDLYCAICGNPFFIETKKFKYCIPTVENFCSIECLRQFFDTFEPELVSIDYLYHCPSLYGDMAYYPEENKYFRSEYELNVYRLLKSWCYHLEYERYKLKDKNSTYIPDFYLKDKDLFIEVKGIWKAGAKKKVKYWYDKINLVVIPWYLSNPIKKELVLCDLSSQLQKQ
ncbi:hypothetical protein [Thermoanaerobacter sp. A7A]|uniref:hypothetical protein n=1 Tax=Thermoanaerobacter sp. A7A TaxID=1350366 RepID=UPI00040ADC8A|nr:hypothetical protein [Thermoanaerobacter sp. A7A]